MGRFSTTVHIKNNVDRMRFVNTFSDVMKKRGFVLCSEDEAAQSYLFAFGEGYGIEEPERGTRKCWENLLADGKTWEQFSETAEKDSVFVEDTLGELAEILGIEPYYICADFDKLLEKADGGNNVTAFYFKKATAKAKAVELSVYQGFWRWAGTAWLQKTEKS